MSYAGSMGLLEKRSSFRDSAEKRLFWTSTAKNTRHLAVSVQIFGFFSWLTSRALANPHATFNTLETLVAVCGMLTAIGMTYAAREPVIDTVGRFACAAFTAFAFHTNITGTQTPAFWVLPMGVAINVGMAPVFSGYFNYLASAVTVWLIISHGEASFLIHAPDSNWIMLFMLSGVTLGLLLNVLFVQERKKTFLVQQELGRLAFRDALTEIHNRRSFMLAIDEYRTRSSGGQAWLLLIDADDFKKINDTSGHDVGDQVLVALARAIEQCANSHVCGRLGGEEFGVIFTGDRHSAHALAKEICGSVASLRISGHALTVSIGIARIAGDINVPETFRLADSGLYEAKRQGKNRHVLVDPCAPELID
jgi:diguanylate cyclase (GGDEF)-like protein